MVRTSPARSACSTGDHPIDQPRHHQAAAPTQHAPNPISQIVSSLGAINKENNGAVQAGITALLEPMGIPADKIYITFNDIARENMGYNGKTFAG